MIPSFDDEPPAGYLTQARDTTYEIDRVLVDLWRRMAPWEKARRLVECCRAVDQLALSGLRLRHPHATDREFEAGNPQALFATSITNATLQRHQYAVAKDGKRFLVNVTQQSPTQTALTVILNWPATVGR